MTKEILILRVLINKELGPKRLKSSPQDLKSSPKGFDSSAQGNAPYALTYLDGYFLSLQEQLFLRLAPARGFGQSIGDLSPMLEHLFEGKPRSYGL